MSQLTLPGHIFRQDARKASRADQKIIVVGFAGGGGTCRGIEKALGRGPDIAINHDRDAIEMHRVNHPACRHIMTDILGVDPAKAVRGRSVGLAWFSPDCTHFSQAKGGTPVKKEIRDLAWVVVRWAKEVGPDCIMLENVREFMGWGPLMQCAKGGSPRFYDDGSPKLVPDPAKKGETFKAWKACLEELGYIVEHRVLKACDYGTPTTRPRLYLVARRDGIAITWPEASHGPKGSGLKRYRTAAECIDFSLPCPSIFMSHDEATAFRKSTGISCVRPLAQNTLDRVGTGYWRYVGNNPKPFVVRVAHGAHHHHESRGQSVHDPLPTIAGSKDFAIVTPYVAGVGGRAGQSLPTGGDSPVGTITGKNDRVIVAPLIVQVNHAGQEFRGQDVREPLPTVSAKHGYAITAPILIGAGGPGYAGKPTPADAPIGTVATENHRAIATAFLAKHYGGVVGHELDRPIGRFAAVYAFLIQYYGASVGQRVTEPIYTITGHDRFGLVTVNIDGSFYAVADIGMRMLQPRELLAAQFTPEIAKTYVLTGTKTSQVHKIGNSVCPPVAAALIKANCSHLRNGPLKTNQENS